MVKIYTRTGDTGTTAFFGGGRVRKDDPRVAAYGTVDELNATLGVVRAEWAAATFELDTLLARIQHRLFDVGAELATLDPVQGGTNLLSAAHVVELESAIDRYQADLEPLKTFILPGGSSAAAQLHLARCVCRRAERLVVCLASHEPVRHELIAYLNRLGDLLFVVARAANQAAGVPDVTWQPAREEPAEGTGTSH